MALAIDDITVDQAVATAMTCIEAGEPCRVVTPNGEFALAADKNPAFLDAINSARIILPDGISVVLAAKIIGRPLGGKVAGIHFAGELCAAMGRKGKRLYILGAKPGVAEKAAENLAAKHPGLVIAGTQDGYYKPEDEPAIVQAIADEQPDALFIAMGAPRSELFAVRYGEHMGVSVMAGIGGSVDIFAGISKRAPAIFIKLGLEWFYRLCKEPWRFKRMMRLPLYLLKAVSWRLRHGKAKD